MAKGDDARRKKNKVSRKRFNNDPSRIPIRLAAIIAAKQRRKNGKRRMCEIQAIQELVNQNTNLVGSKQGIDNSGKPSTAYAVDESTTESKIVPSHYTKKIATRNIKALASCSIDLLQALTDVFFDSPPEKRTYLKEAIKCLASNTEISEVKKIFILLLEKFQSKDDMGESERLETCSSVDKRGKIEVDKLEEQRQIHNHVSEKSLMET